MNYSLSVVAENSLKNELLAFCRRWKFTKKWITRFLLLLKILKMCAFAFRWRSCHQFHRHYFYFLAHQGNPERILFLRGIYMEIEACWAKKNKNHTQKLSIISLAHFWPAAATRAVACLIKAPYFCVFLQEAINFTSSFGPDSATLPI